MDRHLSSGTLSSWYDPLGGHIFDSASGSFSSGDSTGSTSAQSNSAYDALINQKPSTILALNHEVYGTRHS